MFFLVEAKEDAVDPAIDFDQCVVWYFPGQAQQGSRIHLDPPKAIKVC